MNADGQNPRQVTEGFRGAWLSNEKLLIQRLIGEQVTMHLGTCRIYAPFEFNLETQEEVSLWEASASYGEVGDSGLYFFPGHAKLYDCRTSSAAGFGNYQITADNALIPFVEVDDPLQSFAFDLKVILSHAGDKIAQIVVNMDYSPMHPPEGIYVDGDGIERTRILNGYCSSTVAWSPDDNYLIHDLRPHRYGLLSEIVITSVDGTYTYPLLGNDGYSYSSPSWRP